MDNLKYSLISSTIDELRARINCLADQRRHFSTVRDALEACLSHVFPYSIYRENRPDLAAFDDKQLVEHFVTHGINEGTDLAYGEQLQHAFAERDAFKASLSHVFPYSIYRENRPDLAAFDDKQLVEHFLAFGETEEVKLTTRFPLTIMIELKKSLNGISINNQAVINNVQHFIHESSARAKAFSSNVENEMPVIIGRGEEAICMYSDGVITKIYNENYYRYNRLFNRAGEAKILTKLPPELSLDILHYDNSSLSMPYYGEPVGQRVASQYDSSYVNIKGDDIVELIKWLATTTAMLKSAGVSHNDINLCNILFNQITGRFTLIDYSWALLEANFSRGGGKPYQNLPPYLNNGLNDSEVFRELSCLLIRRLISDIGSQGYKDGSSVQKGYVYCKLPFEEFADIPFHKDHAELELDQILTHSGDLLRNSEILEIGSAVGEFTFRIAKTANHITAIEADTFSYRVAEAMKIYKGIGNIDFVNTRFQDFLNSSEQVFHTCLCLNVHMWIEKQLGRDNTIDLLKRLSRRVKHLYFQTAHSASGGMYLVEYLRSSRDIASYLADCGFNAVEEVSRTESHGGERILFYCQGRF